VPAHLALDLRLGRVLELDGAIERVELEDVAMAALGRRRPVPAGVRVVVEADVRNNGNLRPGAFARAEIVTNDSRMAVTVPNNAIVTFAGIEKVLVVENGKALEKPITTGRRTGDWTEIVAGVNVGERVVVDPGNLQSGQAVEVLE